MAVDLGCLADRSGGCGVDVDEAVEWIGCLADRSGGCGRVLGPCSVYSER